MKEIDYKIIQTKFVTFLEFEDIIKGLQKQGWCCIGSVYFGGGIIRREMVKYEEQKPFVGVTDKFNPINPKYGINEYYPPKKEKKEPVQIDPEYLSLADYLIDLIKTVGESPNIKISESQKNKWANEFRLMEKQEGFGCDWIRSTLKKVFDAPGSGSFAWRYVIRSAKKFREHVKAGKLDHLFAEPIRKGEVEVW